MAWFGVVTRCIIPIETLLCGVLFHVITGAEIKSIKAFVIGSDLERDGYGLSLRVGGRDGARCVQTTRGFVRFNRLVEWVTAYATLPFVNVPLSLWYQHAFALVFSVLTIKTV